MKKLLWVLAAAPVLMATTVSTAYALETCKQVPAWCSDGGNDGRQSSVPEPATLALFASGIGALGVSIYRRRKNKRD